MIGRWLARRAERRLHDDTAYGCRYWWGDRAGVNLRAVCPICGPLADPPVLDVHAADPDAEADRYAAAVAEWARGRS